jgi:hypothetical protein
VRTETHSPGDRVLPEEITMKRTSLVLAAACFAGIVAGCGPTYYRVTDPTTGRAYYTTELEKQKSGSVRIRDAGTGNTVTLQNSEVEKVNKEAFETGKVQASMPAEGAR